MSDYRAEPGDEEAARIGAGSKQDAQDILYVGPAEGATTVGPDLWIVLLGLPRKRILG